MGEFFLGVDGGATQTRVVVINKQERIISSCPGLASNQNVLGFEKAFQNLAELVKIVTTGLKFEKLFGCFALSGVNFEKECERWRKACAADDFMKQTFSQTPLVINDARAALRAGTNQKEALVIISGTGSSCYGRNLAGEEVKVGGLDYLLSDQGSGFWIGTQILKAVTASLDGSGEGTKLVDLVFSKFGINSLEELYYLVYGDPWDKTEISKLAFLVEDAIALGDEIATQIATQAACDLALMIKTVMIKLELIDKKVPIVKAGGLLTIKRFISTKLEEEVSKFSTLAEFKDQEIEPAKAAALIAKEAFQNL